MTTDSGKERREQKMEVDRVQAIATFSLLNKTIPPEYIQPQTEQPSVTNGPALEIPVIDLSDADEDKLVREISYACEHWGLFQVVNHGIPTQSIKKLQQVGKEFFELPQDEKEKYAKPTGSNEIQGYGNKLQKEIEGKKSWVDHLFHRVWPPSRIDYHFWPQNPPSYREVNEEYAQYMRGVADKLFACISLGLGLERHVFKEAVGGENLDYLMKINYYPPCPCPELTLGVVAHTDLSSLTILVPNEIPGLQVCKDDRWYDAKYIPNALIVHVGDQIEILSNGKYKAVLHRTTVNKEKARMSWPIFLEPPGDLEVGPLPQLVNKENPAKYKTFKFKEYMYRKLNKLPLN